MIWSYWLRWALIIAGVLLTLFAGWYDSEHKTHAAGYSPVVAVSALAGLGVLEILKQLRDSAKSKGRLSGQTFLDEYTALLTHAIAALQDVHTYNDQQLHQTQTKILKLITAVVLLFSPEAEGLGLSANLMQYGPIELHSAGDKFAGSVFFADPVRAAGSYAGVLSVTAWSSPPEVAPPDFSLPVDKDPARVLFGAPRTFVSGKEIVIPNIHNQKEINKALRGQPDIVRDAIHTFFARQKYKSFMSIAVENADEIIAVLNIQADQTNVFGNPARQTEMKRFIDPFCSILGIITAQTVRSSSGQH